jgi:predicted nucleic acid-binding protein
MNGRNYLFDTNALIELFKGNQTLMQLYKQTDNVALSVISTLKFLPHKKIFLDFIN